MIRSEAEYREALSHSRKSEERLAADREDLRRRGFSIDEIELTVGSAVSLLDDMKDELARYERIKRGDLSDFDTLRDVGRLFIAARLARGLSQRDLADRLGVHESQVSRDERNEYQGISIERAAQILDALSIGLEMRASLVHARDADDVGPPDESGPAARFDQLPDRHDVGAASPS